MSDLLLLATTHSNAADLQNNPLLCPSAQTPLSFQTTAQLDQGQKES